MIPKDLTRDIKTRLNNIRGQIEGIIKMLDSGQDPEQILHQFKAVDKALQKAHFLLLDEVYRKALAIKIVETVEACPGNCGHEDKIRFIKEQFPHFKMDEISQKLKEISQIKERLSRLDHSEDES